MPGEIRFTLNEDEGKSNSNVWKAVGIGLTVGAVALVGTVAAVAHHIHSEDGTSGAALITSTLATLGGGSIESGGDGMVGGLINLCVIGGSGVIAGAAASVCHDTIAKSTRADDQGFLSDYL